MEIIVEGGSTLSTMSCEGFIFLYLNKQKIGKGTLILFFDNLIIGENFVGQGINTPEKGKHLVLIMDHSIIYQSPKILEIIDSN